MNPTSKRQFKTIKHFKNTLFELSLKESNVLIIKTREEQEYGKDEVEQITSDINFLVLGKKKFLVLVIAGGAATITYDALKVLSKTEALNYAHAKAYVLKTISQRLMGNFYLRFFKPEIPIKFFRNEREAETWLLRNFRHLY